MEVPEIYDGTVVIKEAVREPGERGRDGDMVLFLGPNRSSGRRGVTAPGTTLPIFGAKRLRWGPRAETISIRAGK